jgi:hypothetical protein
MPVHRIDVPGSLYAIRLSGNNTTGVVGRIQLRSTQGRPSPPQPFNGFNTAYTPFGNGHVLALSLGGTDEPRNLVPQWEQWQQTGTWRAIESACESHDGKVFRCDIGYDAAALDQYATLASTFATEPLISWADPRLPVSFRVRIYNHDADANLRALATDGDYDRLTGSLDRMAAAFDSGPLDHRPMPPEDVIYWQNEVLRRVSDQAYQSFQSGEQARLASQGKALGSTLNYTNFLLHPETRPSIQSMLASMTGFSPPDIAGLQVDRLLSATHKLNKKGIERFKKMFHKDFHGGHKKRVEATIARQASDREKALNRRRGLV